MNTGVRFFRFNILLPSAFFLSNLELPTFDLSWLCPFKSVIGINALCYVKSDVATLFLKSWGDLSLLLIHNPLEMVVNIMQRDFEGLGIWP